MYLLLFLSARASYDAKDTAEAFVLLSKRHLALRTWHATPASTEPTSGYARTRPRCLKWPLCMSFVACGPGKTCMCALRRPLLGPHLRKTTPRPNGLGRPPMPRGVTCRLKGGIREYKSFTTPPLQGRPGAYHGASTAPVWSCGLGVRLVQVVHLKCT